MFEIGSSLREARTRQGLELEEMELRTKVRGKYLRLLEEERFDQLPGHTYTKGFLRVYADALGLDGRLYVDEYNSRFVAGDEDYAPRTRRVATARHRRSARRESRIVALALLGILVATALVIAAWRFGGSDTPQVQGINAGAPPATATPTQQITLQVKAVNGPSYVEVRVGSPSGAPLYAGTLDRGQTQTFTRKALYLAVKKPQNVVVKVNGNRYPLSSSGEVMIAAASAGVTRPRAAIVVTGSELVRGDRDDRNGPFFAREALALGLEPGRITIVGDGARELEDALREAVESSAVCLVSGGLGPTHDDRTVELVAKVTNRPLRLDPDLEQRIEMVSRTIADRLRRPYADFAAGVRKQASIPEGAVALGPAGTAPGLVVDADGCVVVVMPGPPQSFGDYGRSRGETAPLQRVLAGVHPPRRRTLRFFGVSESAVARALAEAGGDGNGVEATICARDFEIHVDLLSDRATDARGAELADSLRAALDRYLFAEDERSVGEIVLQACRERGYRLATAESCTGGLVAARLTDVPGASDVFVGGVVAYGDEVKRRRLGVPVELLEVHGAVSPEVAAAMAEGARAELGADVAVSVTGIAGPTGGTAEKPVGLVHFHAVSPDGEEALRFELPGDRDWIRSRSAVTALHLVRRLLTRSGHASV